MIEERHTHDDGMVSLAAYSECGRYRYALSHRWGMGTVATFVMLNPSTATAFKPDPTVARCIVYAKRWGYAGCHVANLFALRSTDPKGLLGVDDPVGPNNDAEIQRAVSGDCLVVCAWGGPYHPKALRLLVQQRALMVQRLLGGVPLHCLATTKDGLPRHPLYLGRQLAPTEWRCPR